MNSSVQPNEMLNRKASQVAGGVSLLLALAGIAMVAVYLWSLPDPTDTIKAMALVKIGFLAIVGIAAVQLLRGRVGAQRFLLIVWLAGMVGIVSIAVATVLWQAPTWWPERWPMVKVLPLAALGELVAIALLIRASQKGGRLRYATYVAISIAAAMAVTLAVNMLSQKDYVRTDVETLQRYSLSDRTKRIVQAVDTPVRLTCVYTSANKKYQTPLRRERVMQLLNEMAEESRRIEVINVTTDAEKASLVEQLAGQSQQDADRHIQLLNRFATAGPDIAAAIKSEMVKWQEVTGNSYLDNWGLTAEVAKLLEQRSQAIGKVSSEVQRALADVGIIEHGRLVEAVRKEADLMSKTLEQITKHMTQVRKIPPAVKANRSAATESVDQAIAAMAKMADLLGASNDEVPSDPAAVLEKFILATSEAATKTAQAARAVNQIAGKELDGFIRASQAWMVLDHDGRKAVLPDGSVVTLGRKTLSDAYGDVQGGVKRLVVDTRTFVKAAKTEYQVEIIKQLRLVVAQIQATLIKAQSDTEAALDILSNMDKPTAALIEDAVDSKTFQAVSSRCATFLEQIDELPELKETTLAVDISGENIVVIQAGGKAEVVDFETVWPLKVSPMLGGADDGQEPERIFNGDSVISSKVLSMTDQPFATILLTYYRPQVPQEMARMIPPSDIPPERLTTLRRRLEAANFEVVDWNAREDKPQATDANRPQVLVILPPPMIPPMPMGQGLPAMTPFGPEHMSRISQAIDEGTPAIFLAQFFVPRQMSMYTPPVSPPYLPGDYLRENWGIDVLTEYLVIPAVADQHQPGKYVIDPFRFNYLPLNLFTDHPIGRHLQGQRVMWRELAPIQTSPNLPANVTVESLLAVPKNWTGTWATRDLQALSKQYLAGEGIIEPNPAAGDIFAPFDVAVVATRKGDETAKPARIVVMAMGAGLVDGYLERPVQTPDRKLSDPPRSNADVVINSAYWLVGRNQYIARGPVTVRPIANISGVLLMVLRGVVAIGLPLVAMLLGVIVLFVRRS